MIVCQSASLAKLPPGEFIFIHDVLGENAEKKIMDSYVCILGYRSGGHAFET